MRPVRDILYSSSEVDRRPIRRRSRSDSYSAASGPFHFEIHPDMICHYVEDGVFVEVVAVGDVFAVEELSGCGAVGY
jgi:hypothetical protein